LDDGVGFEGMCLSRSGRYLPSKGTPGSWATITISVSTHVLGVSSIVTLLLGFLVRRGLEHFDAALLVNLPGIDGEDEDFDEEEEPSDQPSTRSSSSLSSLQRALNGLVLGMVKDERL